MPHQVDEDSAIEIEIRRGVMAKAAALIPVSHEDCMIDFNDKGEVSLSLKISDIEMSEGSGASQVPHIIEIARVAEGEHPSYGKLKITKEHLLEMSENFKSKVSGTDIAVNEDHKKREAFGWFKDVFLSFEGDKLYGQVVWNTKGTKALSEKEYRYFSPEFRFKYVHPHTAKEHGATLLGGALTNYPFLKMEAITELSSKTLTKEKDVPKDNTTIDLSEHNAKVVELSNKISEVQVELSQKNKRKC